MRLKRLCGNTHFGEYSWMTASGADHQCATRIHLMWSHLPSGSFCTLKCLFCSQNLVVTKRRTFFDKGFSVRTTSSSQWVFFQRFSRCNMSCWLACPTDMVSAGHATPGTSFGRRRRKRHLKMGRVGGVEWMCTHTCTGAVSTRKVGSDRCACCRGPESVGPIPLIPPQEGRDQCLSWLGSFARVEWLGSKRGWLGTTWLWLEFGRAQEHCLCRRKHQLSTAIRGTTDLCIGVELAHVCLCFSRQDMLSEREFVSFFGVELWNGQGADSGG